MAEWRTGALEAPGRDPWRKFQGAALLAGSRGLSMLAQLGAQIGVGSVAGGAGIGLLQLHTAWTTVLGEVVAMGEPTQALRRNAVQTCFLAQQIILGQALRRIGKAWATALLLSVILALGEYLILDSRRLMDGNQLLLALAILASAPLFAVSRLLAETLKGRGRALGAITLENVVTPTLTLLFCAGVGLGYVQASAAGLLCMAVIGNLSCMLLLLRLIGRHAHAARHPGAAPSSAVAAPKESVAQARRERRQFWMGSLLNIAFLQCPFLLLPLFSGAEEIGHYAVAHKLINVITTLLILLAATYAPHFARASENNDREKLGALLRETQCISLLIYVPFALLALAFHEPLSRTFNISGAALLPLLVVLALGQLINAATGLSGVLLNMSGGAGQEMRILTFSCAVAVSLGLMLAPAHGVVGVAFAMSAAIAFRNIASYRSARQQIQLNIKAYT